MSGREGEKPVDEAPRRRVVHEVNNTCGERHFYALAAADNDGRVLQSCAKAFRVSPLTILPMEYLGIKNLCYWM